MRLTLKAKARRFAVWRAHRILSERFDRYPTIPEIVRFARLPREAVWRHVQSLDLDVSASGKAIPYKSPDLVTVMQIARFGTSRGSTRWRNADVYRPRRMIAVESYSLGDIAG